MSDGRQNSLKSAITVSFLMITIRTMVFAHGKVVPLFRTKTIQQGAQAGYFWYDLRFNSQFRDKNKVLE